MKQQSNPPAEGTSDFLSVWEAAALIRLSPAGIRKYLFDGTLPKFKVGRRVLVKRKDVLGLVAEVR